MGTSQNGSSSNGECQKQSSKSPTQIWLGTPHGTPHRAMMRRSRVAALALVVLFAVAGATAQGEVVTLTDATFEHATQASSGQTTGVFFVKFYAPWCGHCRAMAATWSELAAELDGTGVVIADLDATQNPATTDRFIAHVKGFPTLLLFRDKKVFKHAGARDANFAAIDLLRCAGEHMHAACVFRIGYGHRVCTPRFPHTLINVAGRHRYLTFLAGPWFGQKSKT